MPQGKHSSVRVALAVPPKLHEQLSEWAESEGRPVASLCMYLIEQALRQAQREGIAPSPFRQETMNAVQSPEGLSRAMEFLSNSDGKLLLEIVNRNNRAKGENPNSVSLEKMCEAGVEVINTTSRSPEEEQERLAAMAERFGYESVEEMQEHTGPADTINTVKGRFIKGPKNVDRPDYQAVIEEAKQGKYIKPEEELTKKELLIQRLTEALLG